MRINRRPAFSPPGPGTVRRADRERDLPPRTAGIDSAAEAIAEAIQGIRDGNTMPGYRDAMGYWVDDKRAWAVLATATVVDVTALHRNVLADDTPLDLYEDTTMRPPWVDCAICYQQADGTVIINHVAYLRVTDVAPEERWQPLPPADHSIDWNDVSWVAWHFVYASRGGRTMGPLHLNRMAIAEDGRMLDITWTQLRPDIALEEWTNPQLVTLKTITFLNCRNVTIVEPHRTRPQRRRIDRAAPGLIVTEVQVFPRGVTVRGTRAPAGIGGVPLTTVRGHLARYGPKYGRGLLFGKIEGQFWIPAHARGSAGAGVVEHTYRVEDEA